MLLALESEATTYGYGEKMCCDIGNPCACDTGAITYSGELFDAEKATAAIPSPTQFVFTPVDLMFRVEGGPCVAIRINDKSNPRWIGTRGLDLSPKAVELLTGKRTSNFKQKIELCQ